MFRKLLVPLAAMSTLVGALTSYGVSTSMMPHDTTTQASANVHAEQLRQTAPSESPSASASITPSETPSPTATTPAKPKVPISQQYSYKGEENLTKVNLLMRSGTGKFKTYKPDADKLYHVGKCVVSVYAQAINGYYDATDQQAAGKKLITQYAKALKLKKISVKQGYLYSNEEYGTDKDNYKIDTSYSKFTAKAVHGVVYTRMFNNGFGFISSVTCPTTTKVPDAHKQIRIKTDLDAPVVEKFSDDSRYAQIQKNAQLAN